MPPMVLLLQGIFWWIRATNYKYSWLQSNMNNQRIVVYKTGSQRNRKNLQNIRCKSKWRPMEITPSLSQDNLAVNRPHFHIVYQPDWLRNWPSFGKTQQHNINIGFRALNCKNTWAALGGRSSNLSPKFLTLNLTFHSIGAFCWKTTAFFPFRFPSSWGSRSNLYRQLFAWKIKAKYQEKNG